MNLQNLVEVHGNQVTTTSLMVAEIFEKRHDHVLRDIRELGCSEEFHLPNFGESSINQKMPNGGVKEIPIYEITKNGFVLLAMGYTGEKAMQFKEAYIKAFDAMEKALREGQPKKLPYIGFKVIADMTRLSEKLVAEKNPELRAFLYDNLKQYCDQRGIELSIPRELEKPQSEKDVEAFWLAFEKLNKDGQLDHSSRSDTIAINIPHFYRKADENGYPLKPFKHIADLFRHDKKLSLVNINFCIYSAILHNPIRCAVFKINRH